MFFSPPVPFSSPSETSVTWILFLLILSYRSLRLCSIHFILFFLVYIEYFCIFKFSDSSVISILLSPYSVVVGLCYAESATAAQWGGGVALSLYWHFPGIEQTAEIRLWLSGATSLVVRRRGRSATSLRIITWNRMGKIRKESIPWSSLSYMPVLQLDRIDYSPFSKFCLVWAIGSSGF